ncbi:hypothetical protein EYF80_034998 [Liparis tanakae]|uniref:Uncharacterized protein n=1 Tax=Liparis tanakae TaxID=230148 RepID=A0A4Z2GQ04_9TELE|nr:hypothetical protein EYF80_034998 [Liparis tanakae]
MKKMVSAMRQPSANARLRMRMVVTERRRVRARMLQTMKRLPGTPRRKTMARMTAPRIVEKSLLTTLLLSGLLVSLRKDNKEEEELELFMLEFLILRMRGTKRWNINLETESRLQRIMRNRSLVEREGRRGGGDQEEELLERREEGGVG